MREALFVKQNSEKWEDYEKMEVSHPDELAERFIEITDDLAYAKTFYPTSKTTAYLNGLAARLHQSIYTNKREKANRFVTFWKIELPLVFYTYRKQLLYAAIFFTLFALIGAFSAAHDDTFVRLILGDTYVDMTNANIDKGDPFGVYKEMDPFMMFIMIALNNIKVSCFAFLLGILFSVGTVVLLMYNGIMLGSFQYYFFSKGLGVASVLVIWIHGTLEIAAIIFSGAAGLILGNSILFPKTYSRLVSFKRGGKDGLKIIIGLVPIFIIAAILESFVTRHTGMPTWLSSFILIASLFFIIWYVIIYPKKVFSLQHQRQHDRQQDVV
ncbi:stage II sporulation protein M [Olivibacter sp. SDN3]|uniref:stage II sporulation protein M n=1 Tax=Olivibacter sp. SDN3 TaxID=2764720 RepID=UPI001650FD84|nr:stage II sporulation protein M [Olivibacter sp. SDN3]QNL50660.1 stage II sporulation protein M [Olivibacter sp. SDN3]